MAEHPLPRLVLNVYTSRKTIKIGGGAVAIAYWVTGDTTPITFTIKDDSNAVVNLSGYSGKMYARRRGTGTNKIDGAAIVVTTAASGECEYRWIGADVNQAGVYDCEIELTDGTGYKVTTEARLPFTLMMRSGLG